MKQNLIPILWAVVWKTAMVEPNLIFYLFLYGLQDNKTLNDLEKVKRSYVSQYTKVYEIQTSSWVSKIFWKKTMSIHLYVVKRYVLFFKKCKICWNIMFVHSCEAHMHSINQPSHAASSSFIPSLCLKPNNSSLQVLCKGGSWFLWTVVISQSHEKLEFFFCCLYFEELYPTSPYFPPQFLMSRSH